MESKLKHTQLESKKCCRKKTTSATKRRADLNRADHCIGGGLDLTLFISKTTNIKTAWMRLCGNKTYIQNNMGLTVN